MRTRVYRVEVLIVDHDDVGPDEAIALLEHTKYPNWAISPNVMSIEERAVDWDDDHPLNNLSTQESTFREMFGVTGAKGERR